MGLFLCRDCHAESCEWQRLPVPRAGRLGVVGVEGVEGVSGSSSDDLESEEVKRRLSWKVGDAGRSPLGEAGLEVEAEVVGCRRREGGTRLTPPAPS